MRCPKPPAQTVAPSPFPPPLPPPSPLPLSPSPLLPPPPFSHKFLNGSGQHEHPPLYDLILHAWLRITGNRKGLLRLPSIGFYLLGIWILVETGRRTLWQSCGHGRPMGEYPLAIRFHYGRLAAWYSLSFLVVAILTHYLLGFLRERTFRSGYWSLCRPFSCSTRTILAGQFWPACCSTIYFKHETIATVLAASAADIGVLHDRFCRWCALFGGNGESAGPKSILGIALLKDSTRTHCLPVSLLPRGTGSWAFPCVSPLPCLRRLPC